MSVVGPVRANGRKTPGAGNRLQEALGSKRARALLVIAAFCVAFGFGSLGTGASAQVPVDPGTQPDCPVGVITNTRPPAIGPSPVTAGSALSVTDNGGWTSCGESITGYNYAWARSDGATLASGNAGVVPNYTTTTRDLGSSIQVQMAACNLDGCYMPMVGSNWSSVTCPTTAPQNTAAPTISGQGAIGSAESTSNGSWSSCVSITSYRYQWLSDGGSISGATSLSYTPTSSDWLHTLRSSVSACNQYGCSGYVQSSNSLTIDVRIDDYSPNNYVECENRQAQIWIGLRCAQANQTYGTWKTDTGTTAGPGYVSRLVRTIGNGIGGPATIAQPNNPNLRKGTVVPDIRA
jgi:hypothetical protein